MYILRTSSKLLWALNFQTQLLSDKYVTNLLVTIVNTNVSLLYKFYNFINLTLKIFLTKVPPENLIYKPICIISELVKIKNFWQKALSLETKFNTNSLLKGLLRE